LGTTTEALWREEPGRMVDVGGEQPRSHTTFALSHWFAATDAVGREDILGAQHRLGHLDASTTPHVEVPEVTAERFRGWVGS
jgi:hypothetical protein